MSQDSSHDTGWHDYVLPTYEAQLAGTLALMTCHAHAALHGRACPEVAHKVAANLRDLARNGALSPAFRVLMEQLCARWQTSCACAGARAEKDPADWHPAASRMQ